MKRLILGGLGVILCGFMTLGIAEDNDRLGIEVGSGGSNNFFNSGKKGEKNDSSSTSDVTAFNTMFGTGLDYNKLYNSISANTYPQKYYKQLINAYISASNGDYLKDKSQEDLLLTPDMYAIIHKSETSYATFVSSSPSTLDKEVDIFSTNLNNASSLTRGSGSVWKDNGNDGLPDGPFQFEQGNRDNTYMSNDSPAGKWDIYNFKDNLMGVSGYVKTGKTYTTDKELYGLAGLASHNRGSLTKQLSGVEFWSTGKTKSATPEVYGEQLETFFRPYINAKTNYKLQAPQQDAYALALLIALREDGFYVSHPSSLSHIFETVNIKSMMARTDATNQFKSLFKDTPQENMSYDEFLAWANENKRKPLHNILGISSAECDKIYGTTNGFYDSSHKWGSPYQNTYVYIVRDKPVDLYKNSSSAKGVVAFDFVNLRYCVSTLYAEPNFIELALLAGLPEMIDGEAIDPSNPTYFYKTVEGFNPFSNGSSASEVFKLMGLTVNENQVNSLQALINNRGPYVWGGQGRDISYEAIYAYDNFSTKTNDNIILKKDGTKATSSKDDGALKYSGIRMTDCSAFASLGFSLNQKTYTDGTPTNRSTGGWSSIVGDKKSLEYMGKELDATALQVKADGSTTSTFDTSSKITKETVSKLQPMDVCVYNTGGGGHAWVYVGTNNTGSAVTIPASLTITGQSITVNNGESLFIEQGGSNKLPRVDGNTGKGYSQGVADFSTNAFDGKSGVNVYAYRPTFMSK